MRTKFATWKTECFRFRWLWLHDRLKKVPFGAPLGNVRHKWNVPLRRAFPIVKKSPIISPVQSRNENTFFTACLKEKDCLIATVQDHHSSNAILFNPFEFLSTQPLNIYLWLWRDDESAAENIVFFGASTLSSSFYIKGVQAWDIRDRFFYTN